MSNPTQIFPVEITESAYTIPELEARFQARLASIAPVDEVTITLQQSNPARVAGQVGGVPFYECTRTYQIDLGTPPAPVEGDAPIAE